MFFFTSAFMLTRDTRFVPFLLFLIQFYVIFCYLKQGLNSLLIERIAILITVFVPEIPDSSPSSSLTYLDHSLVLLFLLPLEYALLLICLLIRLLASGSYLPPMLASTLLSYALATCELFFHSSSYDFFNMSNRASTLALARNLMSSLPSR